MPGRSGRFRGRAKASSNLYSGSLIQELIELVDKAEHDAKAPSCMDYPTLPESVILAREPASAPFSPDLSQTAPRPSEPKQFPQALCLGPADWNLALLFIIHAQLVRALEPRDDFPNSVHVHQIGAMSPPKQSLVQAAE